MNGITFGWMTAGAVLGGLWGWGVWAAWHNLWLTGLAGVAVFLLVLVIGGMCTVSARADGK